MDAQTLFREGVIAIREERNLPKGRELLTKSLRLDANNEMAWLWLSRTVTDRDKQRQCVERVLMINPENTQAQAYMARFSNSTSITASPPTIPPKSKPAVENPISDDSTVIKKLLDKAKTLLDQSDTEAAIEQWVRVLEIQADHEEALKNAVRYLSRLKYMDDAHELVWNALNKGTKHPSIYITAIDIAKHEKNFTEADDLRVKLAALPAVDEMMVIDIADHFMNNSQEIQALQVLRNAAESRPKSQKLLLKLADVLKEQGQAKEAFELYERAAQLGTRTKEGKAADEKLLEFAPSLTDKERGSVWLAIREACGIGVLFLLMAWQDAGLNLLNLGLSRLIGVGIAMIGGYLAITATSSPAQQPLARWLGGVVPEPPEIPQNDFEAATTLPQPVSDLPAITLPVRFIMGSFATLLMVLAFWLVFNTAIGLLNNPNPKPYFIPSCNEVFTADFGVSDIC